MNRFLLTALIVLGFLACKIQGQNRVETRSQIDKLNQVSKDFCKTNFDSAGFYANKALKLSAEFDYPAGELNAVINMAEANLYLGSLDTSLLYYNLGLKHSSANKRFGKYNFDAYLGICKIHYYKGDYPMALVFVEKALIALPRDEKSNYIASALNMKGLIFKRTGKLEKAQQQFIEALKYADLKDDHNLRSIVLTNLGVINRNLEQYAQALKYYDRALQSLEILQDTFGMGMLYQNMASVYSDRSESRQSLDYNFRAKAIIEKNNYQSINYATLLNNIGLDYYNLKLPDSALHYLGQALNISIELDDTYGVADTKINLGRVYFENNNPEAARKSIEDGIATAKSIEATDVAIEGYKALMEFEASLGNFRQAFTAQTALTTIRDSLYSVANVSAINDLQEKYESEKKEKQIAVQKIEIEKKQALLTLYLLLLFIIGSALLTIGYLYRKKKLVLQKLVEKNLELVKNYKNNSPKEKNKAISGKQQALHKQFLLLMDQGELFRDQDLNLDKLAKSLHTNRSEVSEMINTLFDSNYATLINGYRIRHAIRLLSDPRVWEKYSIEGIAMESGFKSQSVFYKFFKEQTGLTPISFVKNRAKSQKMFPD